MSQRLSMFAKLIFLMCMSFCIHAQDLFLKRDGSELGNRYGTMKNEPYAFKDWIMVDLTDRMGHEIKDVKINYNGYTGELETQVGEKIFAMDGFYYPRFVIKSTKAKYVYSANTSGNYVREMFNGERSALFTQFVAKLDEKGDRFNSETISYIIKDRKTTTITKENDLLKVLNDEKASAFAKNNKINPNDLSQACILLAYLEKNN